MVKESNKTLEFVDFERRIEAHLVKLTKNQQKIASYLLVNYDEAAFLTAYDIAIRLEVSEATVVRFAKAIGYRGFPELRLHLQELFRIKVTPASRLRRTLSELASNKNLLFAKVIEMEVQYLSEAAHVINPSDFDRAVTFLLNARRVFVFDSGSVGILADLAELRLTRIGFFTITMKESGRYALEKLQLLERSDVVLAFGFHHVQSGLLSVLEHSHSLGCATILITDTLGPKLRRRVEIVLAARRGPISMFHSLTVPMSILNALILGVAMARPAESMAAMGRLQKLRASSGFNEIDDDMLIQPPLPGNT